jgi:nicotinamidase-related amidase
MTDRPELAEVLNRELQIDPSRTAVLAIDTHRGHLDPEIATMPVAADIAADVVAASVRLLEGTRAAGIPTAFVVMNNRIVQGESEYLRNPFWNAVESARLMVTPDLPSTISGHNLPGSPQTEVMPELAPGPDDYIINSKHRLSSWLGTELDSWLRMLKIDTVLLIGINTNTCVQCAAFEAFNRDYAAIVVSDCVHSMYGADLHDYGLQNVSRCFGWVLSTDEVLDKLGASTAAAGVPSASAA